MTDQKDPNIKIYVVCHKPAYVPDNPYLYPIQVGTAMPGRKRLEGMLHDDEGDNISSKNDTYCELTAQYWAWKNDDADYYGFFHYRRYLAFDPELKSNDRYGNVAYDCLNDEVVKEIKLEPEHMRDIICAYDMITVQGREYTHWKDGKRYSVYSEYSTVLFQHQKDLDFTLKILFQKYPEFKAAADLYMKASIAHECNMYIMRKDTFKDYCAWLFDILFAAEKEIDRTWYSVEENRVMGYLAERLCGIYYTYLTLQKDKKTLELPKTMFRDTTPRQTLDPVYPDGIPIVLSANDRFAPYLDVMIRSIVANASKERNYDIIVLYNDISERNQRLIQWDHDELDHVTIRFIKVSNYFDASKLFVDQHLSVETYYRLIIPEIMPNYHKILYLDCDMVVDHDVAELYDLDLEGNIIGAAKDIDVAGQVNLKQNHWETYAVETLGLDQPYDYFQAGVLVIDLDLLRKTISSKEMIDLALSHAFRCHDQDVLNIVCKNRVYYLPQQWNTLMSWEEPDGRSRMQIMKMAHRDLYQEYMAARQKPYIVHFAGWQKPWEVVDCDFADYFWRYARESLYYPKLIWEIQTCLDNQESNSKVINADVGVWKIVNQILPYGSRRREWIKTIFHKIK